MDTAPLLVQGEDEAWEALENGSNVGEEVTMKELIELAPDKVLEHLKTSAVKKLGTFTFHDASVFEKFATSPLLTLGSDRMDIDYETEWRRYLEEGQPAAGSASSWPLEVSLEAYVVTVRDAAAPDVEGVLHQLVKRYQTKACSYSVFGLPPVQAVINFKWRTFARRLLIWELVFYMLWLASFTIFTFLFQDEDLSSSLSELVSTTRGKVSVAANLLSLVGMLPFLIMEISTMWAYGMGWINVWNSMDLILYVIQIIVTYVHLSRHDLGGNWLSIVMALQHVLLWFRVQYFSRVFRPTRFAFVDSIKTVIADIRWYLFFMLLLMWGFACAFYILFREDQQFSEFDTMSHAFFTMFTYAVGGTDLGPMRESQNPTAAITISIAYQFLMSMILMSLLVGLMSNSLNKVTEHEDLKLLQSMAEIIDELETTLPSFLERLFPKWYPRYVHVLRIDQDSINEVEKDFVWSKLPNIAGDLAGDPSGASSDPAPPEGGMGAEEVKQVVAQELASQLKFGRMGRAGRFAGGVAIGPGSHGGEGSGHGAEHGASHEVQVLTEKIEELQRQVEALTRLVKDEVVGKKVKPAGSST